MEEDKKIVASETVTYVFGSANDQDMIKDTAPTRGLLWQVVPCTCASLICIPFGLMLGWPSPTYPYLLNNVTSPILISMDQSAMIAGFLMLGNTIGTPLSATESLGPKYGVLVGLAAMTSGWFVMWQANNIYYLLEFVPDNLRAVSDEHGKGLHQQIAQMEKRYSRKWAPNMLADYCGTIKRETAPGKYKRRKTAKYIF
ncbi:unnamed protein product [Acanthoscelides obtectus]|uniref:Uncharacterized protein n=1 Tax=Acanthoscelides obtectus TaxID=200917 RepID=A0A9P0KBG6_ACAOB|nr:unnamed protein product [Acanthoscelides obtectus]CAK1633220.1 hypothetical protein AOBTE_LOCUS7993 [Acanthoscelides obtectus]